MKKLTHKILTEANNCKDDVISNHESQINFLIEIIPIVLNFQPEE